MPRYIGVGSMKDGGFPFDAGDRILERSFLSDKNAIEFAKEYLKSPEFKDRKSLIILNISSRHPRVVAVLDF